jgi:hypothetical protein
LPFDPGYVFHQIGIAWPGDVEPVLSDKDAHAPSLAQALAAGLLTGYAGCLAYAARLCGT